MTSKQLKQNVIRKTKNVLKAGSVQENVEINEHSLDENLQNNKP